MFLASVRSTVSSRSLMTPNRAPRGMATRAVAVSPGGSTSSIRASCQNRSPGGTVSGRISTSKWPSSSVRVSIRAPAKPILTTAPLTSSDSSRR